MGPCMPTAACQVELQAKLLSARRLVLGGNGQLLHGTRILRLAFLSFGSNKVAHWSNGQNISPIARSHSSFQKHLAG